MKNLSLALAMSKRKKMPKEDMSKEPVKAMSLDPKALAQMIMKSKAPKEEPMPMYEGGEVEAMDMDDDHDFDIEGEPMGLSEDDLAEDDMLSSKGILQRIMNRNRMR